MNARFMKVGNQGSVTVTTKQQILEVPLNVTISISPGAAHELYKYCILIEPPVEAFPLSAELVDMFEAIKQLLRVDSQ